MVDLGGNGIAAGWQAVEVIQAFNHVHFPGGTTHVQGTGMVARHVYAELSPVAGLGQATVRDVILEVEEFVLDPVRVIKLQWQSQEASRQQRIDGKAALYV